MDIHILKTLIDEVCEKYPPGTLSVSFMDEYGVMNLLNGFSIIPSGATTLLALSDMDMAEGEIEMDTLITKRDAMVIF